MIVEAHLFRSLLSLPVIASRPPHGCTSMLTNLLATVPTSSVGNTYICIISLQLFMQFTKKKSLVCLLERFGMNSCQWQTKKLITYMPFLLWAWWQLYHHINHAILKQHLLLKCALPREGLSSPITAIWTLAPCNPTLLICWTPIF